MSQTGTRIYPDADGHLPFTTGAYGQDADGLWWVQTPSNYIGAIGQHTVEEHEDGTITVSPSILTPGPPDGPHYWHGYLVHGEWRPC